MNRIFLIAFFLVVSLTCLGCKSRDIKSITPSANETPAPQNIKNEAVLTAEGQRLLTSSYQYSTPDFYWMKHTLRNFRSATRTLPDNMRELLNSGYILIWPREPVSGKPVWLYESDDYLPNENLLGSFQYSKNSDDQAEYNYVQLDWKKYRENGEKEWFIHNVKVFSDNLTSLKGEPIYSPELSYIAGGKLMPSSIDNTDLRKLFVLCSLFESFLEEMTDLYYQSNNRLPNSLQEMLDNKHYIVKESFLFIISSLKSKNCILRCGFDYKQNAFYFIFTADGQPLISRCWVYGVDMVSAGNCKIEELDISAPIIDENTIGESMIPNEFYISMMEIPVGGE